MLALELLGPVALTRNGAALPLTVRKTAALLVLLALGGSMPRPRVVAMLWPTLDESTGRRNLRRELARLRESGAEAAVLAEGDRLLLAPSVSVDAAEFARAATAGRHQIALQRWRGPPADGLTLDDAPEFTDWLVQERDRLRTLRRQALEALAESMEAQGDLAGALLHFQQLLADDPLQERHHRAAMRLLGRLGRREEALAQYRQCSELLSQELGLAPMADTEALAAQLRGHEAALAISPRRSQVPASILPGQLPFVGRQAEVAALEAAWRAGRAVLIEGEGGVGKTRLAVDVAAVHGACALVRCRPGDAELPYASFTRALRTMAGPEPDLGGLPVWARDELARLLPELGPAPAPIRSAEERSRFFEACALGWQSFAADNFDILLLDDWHLADPASLALLGHAAQRRREQGQGGALEWLLLRPTLDAPTRQRLADGLDAVQVQLQPLEPAEVFDLVQRLSGAGRPERFAARLQQATAGNPFFLAETLRHLAEQQWLTADADGRWRTPFDDVTQDYRELPVPASVHEAVLARVRRLGAAAVRVLEAAALATEPFAPALLAPACALSELDAVLAIEQAVQGQFLREHEAGGYAFAHDLVRQAFEVTLSDERRRLVHRRLALGAEAGGAPPALVAAHHEASGERRRAVSYRLAAGDQAQRLHALPDAITQWRRGLADDPTPSQALALRLRLMRALRLRHEREAALAEAAALRALAEDGALSPAQGLDALIAVAGEWAQSERASDALALLEGLPQELSELPAATALRARVDALRELGRVDEALAVARQALASPALQGPERAGLLDAMLMAEHLAGRPELALALLEASLAISTRDGDEYGVARGLYRRGVFLIELGQLAQGEAELRRAVTHCARLGIVGIQRAALYNLCCVHSAQGDPAQVLVAAQQSWDLQPPFEASELRVMTRLAFVDAHLALGDLGAAWAHAASAVDDGIAVGEPFVLASVAMTCLDLFGLLGERKLVDRLMGKMDVAVLRQMPQASNELWIALAQFELRTGSPAAARRALNQVVAPQTIANQRIRLRLAVTEAELAAALGDTQAALQGLPDDEAPGHSDELRAHALVVRVVAEAASGSLQAATTLAVSRALAHPPPHAVPAMALRRAWWRATHDAVAGVPEAPSTATEALVTRLADSLRPYPAQRAAFVRAWVDDPGPT